MATVPGSNLTYVDTTGAAGTNYSYYVVPLNAEGAGPSSASEIASPQSAAPIAADNTMLYVGAAIVVLAIIVGAAMIMRRRKKSSK